jgi:hypothetical protein
MRERCWQTFSAFCQVRGLSFLPPLPYHTERCLGSNLKSLVLPVLRDVVASLLMRRLV